MKTPSWVSNKKKIKEELGQKIKNLNQQLFDLDEIKRENANLNKKNVDITKKASQRWRKKSCIICTFN